MDALNKDKFYRELSQYGYDLVAPESGDPESVLLQLVQSDDGRLLEGFPVVLTNMLMQGQSLDLESLEKKLSKGLQRRFRTLVATTYHFLSQLPDSKRSRKVMRDYLKSREPSLLDSMKKKLKQEEDLLVGKNVRLSVSRLQNTFANYAVASYKEEQELSLAKVLEEERNVALMESLSELFTDKQKDLMFKVLNKEALTKTEREYFSRVVKRRLKAIRNSDLQSLAQTLVGF